MTENFPFILSADKALPKKSNDSRFYIVDPVNTISSLFIERCKFSDSLIQQTLNTGFEVVYQTPLCERICSASASFLHRWYLITLIRFTDGIDNRPSYRSIFVSTKEDRKLPPTVFPISSRTFSPQYVAWTSPNDSFEFKFTVYDKLIHTYDLVYDPSIPSFKIISKRSHQGYTFRSGIVSHNSHVFYIQNENENSENPILMDKSKIDLFPKNCHLPNIEFNPNTEFRVFITQSRRNISQQINTERCILITNDDKTYIIFPFSGTFCEIHNNNEYLSPRSSPHSSPHSNNSEPNKSEAKTDSSHLNHSKNSSKQSKSSPKHSNHNKNEIENNTDSLKNSLKPKISEKLLKMSHINFHPSEAMLYSGSQIPLSLYTNEFLLVAAPVGYLTAALIDQADRVRAAFRIKSNEVDGFMLNEMSSINDNSTKVLCQKTGSIFKCDLNPKYFIQKDPSLILPLLHYIVPKKKINDASQNRIISQISSLLSKEVIHLFWNGEVFNELLLLHFNTIESVKTFSERICSTFIKPKFYKKGLKLFTSYSFTQKESDKLEVEPIFNFKEIEKKAPRIALDCLPLTDLQALYDNLIKILEEYPLFNVSPFPLNVQFSSYLQITAIKLSIAKDPTSVKINQELFCKNTSKTVKEIWSALNMLKKDVLLPEPDFTPIMSSKNQQFGKMEIMERQWWFLRSSDFAITQRVITSPESGLFNCVEQVTNKNKYGNEIFQLHQNLFGLQMHQPICDI